MPVPDDSEATQRSELVKACHHLASTGLIGAAEGNLSVRLGPRRILTTPSGSNKSLLEPHQLVVTDLEGNKIVGSGRASTELKMHLAIYRNRPEVRAIVHAHPPTAIALTLAKIDLSQPAMPEEVTALGGGIPTAPYASPSTEELAESVAKTLASGDACLMERHGAIAVGRTLAEASDRMETVERIAQVILRACILAGPPTPLPREEIEHLLELCGRR
jgi:L-fuculose-phosphate aldolase